MKRSIFMLSAFLIIIPMYVGAEGRDDASFQFIPDNNFDIEADTQIGITSKRAIDKKDSKVGKQEVVLNCNEGKNKARAQVAFLKDAKIDKTKVKLEAKCCKKASERSLSCGVNLKDADTIYAKLRIPKPDSLSLFAKVGAFIINAQKKDKLIEKRHVCPLSKALLTFYIDVDGSIKTSCGKDNNSKDVGGIGKNYVTPPRAGASNYSGAGLSSGDQAALDKLRADQAAVEQQAMGMQQPYYNPPPSYGSAPIYSGEQYSQNTQQYNNEIGNQEDSDAIDSELEDYELYKDEYDDDDSKYERDDGSDLSGTYLYEETVLENTDGSLAQLPAYYDTEEFYYSDGNSSSILGSLLDNYQTVQAQPWELDGLDYEDGKAQWSTTGLGGSYYGDDYTEFMIANGVPAEYAYANLDEDTWNNMSLVDKVLYSRNRDAWDARFGDAVATDVEAQRGHAWYNPYGWWINFRDWIIKTSPVSDTYDI